MGKKQKELTLKISNNFTAQFYKDSNGEWRWNVVAANGNLVANGGEGYNRYRDARSIVDALFFVSDPAMPSETPAEPAVGALSVVDHVNVTASEPRGFA